MKFKPVYGKYLIKPLKNIQVTKRVPVPDEEANKDKKPGDVREIKKVNMKVLANFQLAEIVAAPDINLPNVAKYEVGETVVFRPNPIAYTEFDLIKGVYLIDAYLIVGKWVDEIVNE